MLHVFKTAASAALRNLLPEKYKERHELKFWEGRYAAERGHLSNAYYEKYYTTFFGIDRDAYQDRRIMDIGCGPRGSLEWADMASERIGLDSLANEYKKLGADKHKMTYVDAGAENIPFADGYFDAVFSFNSLDHVRDIDLTIAEIKRVVKPGGLFLLITEFGHAPTPTEPQSFSSDIVERFTPEFKIASCNSYQLNDDHVYKSLDARREYDPTDDEAERAVLCAKLIRQTQ